MDYDILNHNSVTADGVIKAGACRVFKVYVTGDGTNAGRVIFYDNASAATADVLAELRVALGETVTLDFNGASIRALNGIYADVTTVGRADAFFL